MISNLYPSGVEPCPACGAPRLPGARTCGKRPCVEKTEPGSPYLRRELRTEDEARADLTERDIEALTAARDKIRRCHEEVSELLADIRDEDARSAARRIVIGLRIVRDQMAGGVIALLRRKASREDAS